MRRTKREGRSRGSAAGTTMIRIASCVPLPFRVSDRRDPIGAPAISRELSAAVPPVEAATPRAIIACLLFFALAAPLVAAPETSSGSDDGQPTAKEERARDEDVPEPDAPPLDASTAGVDRLERAIEDMRNAKERIDGEDTGHETQNRQKQAVTELEELLKQLRKQQQSSRNNPSQNQNPGQDGSQDRQQKVKPGQGDPQNSGSKDRSDNPGDPHGGRRNPDKSRDSQARSDPDRAAAAEQARRAQMIKDVWGHLPPHLRAAMQNAFSEKYLPKYEDLVKKYYESLAEKNRRKK